MIVYSEEKLPIKSWCNEPEEGAINQARNLANLPFAFKHIALMPDTHQGYGMPIGGVLATQEVIIPNAVGVDIGCGMCAVKTKITDLSTEQLKTIMGKIREVVPVGFNKHKIPQDETLMPKTYANNGKSFIMNREYDKALYSLGTLGGGNHFIELQKDKDDNIWIMIHSGSRKLGKQVADYYNKLAKHLNKSWVSSVPPDVDLAFFPINSEEGQDYIKEMQYCIQFALNNRYLMMQRVIGIFQDELNIPGGGEIVGKYSFNAPKDNGIINIAHNYAAYENHFGKNVMVHRKGATLARPDIIGIIPGSQGTKSYIVQGKGDRDSFHSCSHGAGRNMGRKQAQRTLNLEEEKKKLDDQGIIHSIRNVKDLDEASGAYKDIDVVMDEQKDLVDILVELTPIAVVKG